MSKGEPAAVGDFGEVGGEVGQLQAAEDHSDQYAPPAGPVPAHTGDDQE